MTAVPVSTPDLILASSSPRREHLLEVLGVPFRVLVTEVDERRHADESACDMVLRLASAKAVAVNASRRSIVIAADTAVVLGEHIFGKPADEADALSMLERLSGRTHQVMTGVAVSTRGSIATALSKTDVRFREIDPEEARRYWHSGEPCDKAGAYAIQGRGGVFVEAIMGSYSGVVGLPVFETARLLQDAGVDVLEALKSEA